MNMVAINLVGIFGLVLIGSALLYQAQYRKLDIERS